MLARDPCPLICHSKNDTRSRRPFFTRCTLSGEPDRAARATIFYRIVQEVMQHLGNLVRITTHAGDPRRENHVQSCLVFRKTGLHSGDNSGNKLTEVESLGRGLVFDQFNPRKTQQIINQPIHAFALLGHNRQKALLSRRIVGCRTT
jgi:hypothetical protein